MNRARAGVDVGGTFTDAVLIEESGALRVAKVRSTPARAASGFVESLARLGAGKDQLPDVSYLAHGTTVATNALVQRRLSPIALITNVGFRDLLAIGTQQRKHLYDLRAPDPEPIVPRRHCYEVGGRIGSHGEEVEALSEADVAAVADRLHDEGIEAVAVVFLFSFVNSTHERCAAEILRERAPEVAISLSSDVAPEFREYRRGSTTAVNAALLPLFGRYLDDVGAQMTRLSSATPIHLMQSNGGVAVAETAARFPVGLVSSGPAAGVIGAAQLGQAVGEPNLLTFDMGGTTADVALVRDGLPQVRFEAEPGGCLVNLPQIDVLSIGAGGGSIARVDEFGRITVGPQSAGAEPGPACYNGGGEEPTVTDAHVALGTIDASRSLGGVVGLDRARARLTIERRLAEPLGISCEEAAWSIIRIADANMTNALRVVSIAHGHDPREFGLVALGGAGPLHACAIAEELGVARVIVPRHPGVTAALGLLLSDVRHDLRRTWIRPTDEVDPAELDALAGELEGQGRELLALSNQGADSAMIALELDMRYRGQAYNLTVTLASRPVTAASVRAAEQAFYKAHLQAYNYIPASRETEIVTVRVRAHGRIEQAPLSDAPSDAAAPAPGRREIWIDGEQVGFDVVQRDSLGPGSAIAETTLIEQEDATTLVPIGWTGRVSGQGLMLLNRSGATR